MKERVTSLLPFFGPPEVVVLVNPGDRVETIYDFGVARVTGEVLEPGVAAELCGRALLPDSIAVRALDGTVYVGPDWLWRPTMSGPER